MTKRNQFITLLLWPIVAAVFSLEVHANFLVGTVLFFGIPALLLTWWSPAHVKKASWFALAFTPIWLVIDLLIYVNHQWYAVSAFPQRIFGLIAIEEIPWVLLAQYFIVMFWEHFFERKRRERPWRRRMTYLAAMFAVIFAAVLVVWQQSPTALEIPYFYFVLASLFFVVPAILELTRHPNLAAKLFRVSLYFIYLFLVYELTALNLGQWSSPGRYVGWIDIAGLAFPVEEFIAWIVFGAAACLAWYEHFDDDEH